MSDEQIRTVFRNKLNQYMDAQHITPNDICNALGVSRGLVSQWRKGMKVPRIDKIDGLAKLFGCSRSDLLEEEKPPTMDGKVFELVTICNQLTDENLLKVADYIRYLLSTQA